MLCKKNYIRQKTDTQTRFCEYNQEWVRGDINNKLSKDETEIEKPNEIVDIARRITDFNNKNQEGQGLKILTPEQILSRLPITLAQLKAGNNLQELKNEIRQLLYSLYRPKKIRKTIYNNLMNTI